MRGLTKEVKEALWNLSNAVNQSRYRGAMRDGPLTDKYHWPMDSREYERIANAALTTVLEIEKAENKTNER